MVKEGDGCSAIASKFGITLEQFLTWNPAAGSTCGGLWKDAYACVSIIRQEGTKPPATSTKPPTTSTKSTNGVVTPTPTQPNMADNCNQFHFVVGEKDTCASIATKYAISLATFLPGTLQLARRAMGSGLMRMHASRPSDISRRQRRRRQLRQRRLQNLVMGS
jgi:hypothetical protein